MVGRLAIAAATLLMLGCSSPVAPMPSATAAPTPSLPAGHPTGERDLVLGLTVYGWPWPVTVGRPAEFSLYGDGRAIFLANRHALPGALPVLKQARLSGDQIEELLGFALHEGGLAAARDRYEVPSLVDHDWTVFEIDAFSARKEVWVYALGEADAPDAADRVMFERLAERLGGVANDVAAGDYEDLGIYRPEGYSASLSELRPNSDLHATAEWPWSDLDLTDFDAAPDGTLILAITAAQGQTIIDLGITENLVVEDEAGHRYVVRIRPQLPDEVSS
jgi:hypothetical protein